MGFNGWLAVIGPGGTAGLADRQLSMALACAYTTYPRWLCPRCQRYLHSAEMQRQALKPTDHYQGTATPPYRWYHAPCQDRGPINPPWANEHAITTILYAYHSQFCARPETSDDLRKLMIFGKKVVVLAHDIDGLANVAPYVYGVLCTSPQAEADLQAAAAAPIRASASVPHALPLLPPGGTALATVVARHLIGWHGRWRPDRNVHSLIEAVAKLRAAGHDAGLIALGGFLQPGLRPAPSSLAYLRHCLKLVERLDLRDHCALVGPSEPGGYIRWADLQATLRQCALFCVPTVPHPTTGKAAAVLTCLSFQKPTVVTAYPAHRDALEGAIPLTDVTPTGIAARLTEVIEGTVTPPQHAVLKINAMHQPLSIQHRYLKLLRDWTAPYY